MTAVPCSEDNCENDAIDFVEGDAYCDTCLSDLMRMDFDTGAREVYDV